MSKTRLTVLVIDDDSGDIAICRRYLENIEEWQVECIKARNIEEGLQKLDDHDVEIILLDYLLGADSGLEALKRIRQNNVDCPVIMLTGQGNEEVAVTAMQSGAYDYLVKGTLSSKSLYRAIHNALEKRDLQKQIEDHSHQLEQKICELEEALAHVKRLQGLLPICMHCKRIRDDTQTWRQMESYIQEHSDAMFSHALCEDCRREHYPFFENQRGSNCPE
ncbi:MAG: response regulator [candidate division Zixibacteria bacterium]|nr:response regulator [candidate division Zixibacteria bacterium]MBU1471778.1 response regulator [candidate division Zixibacteria bacterium]MBU2624336.1 response regulator [candidate division Zixibacteria bacterium]